MGRLENERKKWEGMRTWDGGEIRKCEEEVGRNEEIGWVMRLQRERKRWDERGRGTGS